LTTNMAKNKLKQHNEQDQNTNEDDKKEETVILTSPTNRNSRRVLEVQHCHHHLPPPPQPPRGKADVLKRLQQQQHVREQQHHQQKEQALQQKKQVVQQKKDQLLNYNAAVVMEVQPGSDKNNITSRVLFPEKLLEILNSEDVSAVCWLPQGNAFNIPDLDEFSRYVLPRYFQHNNLTAFQRQLNLHGFIRVTNGKEPLGFAIPLAYRHDIFHKDHPNRSLQIEKKQRQAQYRFDPSVRKVHTHLTRTEAVAEQSSGKRQQQQSLTPRPVSLDSSNRAVSLSSASINIDGGVTTSTTSPAAAINNASCSSSGQKRRVVIDVSCLSDSGDNSDNDDIVDNNDNDNDDNNNKIHDRIRKQKRIRHRNFEERLSNLADYKRTHGNMNVPIRHEGYGNLGRWVGQTRYQLKLYNENKPTKMTKERAQVLEKIDFPTYATLMENIVDVHHEDQIECENDNKQQDNEIKTNNKNHDGNNESVIQHPFIGSNNNDGGCNDDDNNKIAENGNFCSNNDSDDDSLVF